MKKQYIYFIAAAAIILIIGIILIMLYIPNSENSINIQKDYSINEIQRQNQKINLTFTGNSDTITDPFYLEGLIFIRGRYGGNSNFQVHIIDEKGNIDYLFNEIGDYDGTTSGVLSPGQYRMEIAIGTEYSSGQFSSQADWIIDITN